MDFRDSPDEAAFRDRLRGWLAGHAKGGSRRSGDEYWAAPGRMAPRAVRGRLLRPVLAAEYGGQELPPVYDVIVDEELARDGAPPRPSLGYLVVGWDITVRGVPVLPGGRVAAVAQLDAEAGDRLLAVDAGDQVRVPPGKPAADLRAVLLSPPMMYMAPSRIGAWFGTLIAYTSDDGSCGLRPW